jgi:hypothetical protein
MGEKENPIDSYFIYFCSGRSVDGARVTRRQFSLVNISNSYFEKVPKMLGFPTDPIAGGELWRKRVFRLKRSFMLPLPST